MRYHNITKDDMLNGDGLRAVLWVAGCTHKCKGCHNPVTWDIEGGIPFDDAAKEELFEELKKEKIFVRHFNGERIKDYLRISIGTDQQMDCLLQAIDRIMA